MQENNQPENAPNVVRTPRAVDKKMAMTRGFALYGSAHPNVAGKFVHLSLEILGKTSGEPSMTVGDPNAQIPEYQDQGRTVILPIHSRAPKLYACQNETGGFTFMLAEEY